MEKTAFARGFEKAAEMMKLDAEQTEGLRQLVAACDQTQLTQAAQEWAAKTAAARQEFDWSQMGEMLKQAVHPDLWNYRMAPEGTAALTGLGSLGGAGVGAGLGALLAGKGKRKRGAGIGAAAGALGGGALGYLSGPAVARTLGPKILGTGLL